ncbi:MAG: hypothetical protein ACJA1L_003004 [Paracoccaceae bacterium]|jgi:hypothetical protein
MARRFETGDAVIWFGAGGPSGGMVREVYACIDDDLSHGRHAAQTDTAYLIESVDGAEVTKRHCELSLA